MNSLIIKIETDNAPQAIGPYSQAVIAGSFVFVSGQIALDPATGRMLSKEISMQTVRVLDNLEAILKSRGITLDQVVRTEIFLTNINDFGIVNEIYGKRFSAPVKPARQVVEVSNLPKGALIEISCIAQLPVT